MAPAADVGGSAIHGVDNLVSSSRKRVRNNDKQQRAARSCKFCGGDSGECAGARSGAAHRGGYKVHCKKYKVNVEQLGQAAVL